MDKRLEDKIAMMAFGELSEREAAEVREIASRDPEAARMLASYEGMKSDLRLLRDVPPDQMSSERLQDAILAQGLKPKPETRRAGFGWLWVPAGLVLGFVVVNLYRTGGDATPTIVMDSSGTETFVASDRDYARDPAFDVRFRAPEPERLFNGSFTSEPSPATAMQPVEDAAIVAPEAGTSVPAPRQATTRRTPRAAQPTADAAVAMSVPEPARMAAPSVTGPLVVIASERDVDTGAQRAFEVDREGFQDVLVSS